MPKLTARTPVLSYYEYVHYSQNPRGTRHFCGACEQCITGSYGGDGSVARVWTPKDMLEAMDEEVRSQEATITSAKRVKAGEITMEEYLSGAGYFDLPEPREYRHFAFCPWCGAHFKDDWWKRDRIRIRNERPIDHFQNPGRHPGDSHLFTSISPNARKAVAHH